MNIYKTRMKQEGTSVIIDGALSDAERIDLDSIIPMPYILTASYTNEIKSVVYNNEIHVMGGDGGHLTDHYKWNGSSWVSVSTLPIQLRSNSICVYENKIHIIGGIGTEYTQKHYAWDGSSWNEETQFPRTTFADNGILIVYNGVLHALAANYMYKYVNNQWVASTDVPYTRGTSAYTVYDNAIHILGGSKPTNHYKWNGTSWSSVSTLPISCSTGVAVTFDNKIHLFSDGLHYSWNGSSWSEEEATLCVHRTQGFTYNNRIMLLGGYIYSSFIEPVGKMKDVSIS